MVHCRGGVIVERSWVCEEFGGIGAQQYFQAHKDEVRAVWRVSCI